MGWNGRDAFATTETEEQIRAQADYMAEHPAPYGREYVVDIQRYEPETRGFPSAAGSSVELPRHGAALYGIPPVH